MGNLWVQRKQLYDTVDAKYLAEKFASTTVFAEANAGHRNLTNQKARRRDTVFRIKRLLVGGPAKTLKTWDGVGITLCIGNQPMWQCRLWSPPDKGVKMTRQKTPMGWVFFGWDFVGKESAAEREANARNGKALGYVCDQRSPFHVIVDKAKDGMEPVGRIRVVLDGDMSEDID